MKETYRGIIIDPFWDDKLNVDIFSSTSKIYEHAIIPINFETERLKYDNKPMSYGMLTKLPINNWVGDTSFMWLWATNGISVLTGKPILYHAFELMEYWGFRYYTTLTWIRPNSYPLSRIVNSPYVDTTTPCLFGYKGKCIFPKHSLGKLKTWFRYKNPSEDGNKPDSFYDDIRNNFEGPFVNITTGVERHGFKNISMNKYIHDKNENTTILSKGISRNFI